MYEIKVEDEPSPGDPSGGICSVKLFRFLIGRAFDDATGASGFGNDGSDETGVNDFLKFGCVGSLLKTGLGVEGEGFEDAMERVIGADVAESVGVTEGELIF